MTDEEVETAIVDQSVSEAYRLIGKRDCKPFPLRTVFLSTEVLTLPSTIHVVYERATFRAHIPNPMRCFRCQKFG